MNAPTSWRFTTPNLQLAPAGLSCFWVSLVKNRKKRKSVVKVLQLGKAWRFPGAGRGRWTWTMASSAANSRFSTFKAPQATTEEPDTDQVRSRQLSLTSKDRDSWKYRPIVYFTLFGSIPNQRLHSHDAWLPQIERRDVAREKGRMRARKAKKEAKAGTCNPYREYMSDMFPTHAA